MAQKSLHNIDEFLCFFVVVSTGNAAAADPSTAVFSALRVSAAALCAAVSRNGKCYVVSRDFSLRIRSRVGIPGMNGIMQNLIIQIQLQSVN